MQTDFVSWMQEANSASLSFFNIPINNFPHVEIRSNHAGLPSTDNDPVKISSIARSKPSSVGINFINRQHPIEQTRKLVQKGAITGMCWSKTEQFLATCSSEGSIRIWSVDNWVYLGDLVGERCPTEACKTEFLALSFLCNDAKIIAVGGKTHHVSCPHGNGQEPILQVFNIEPFLSNSMDSTTTTTINAPHHNQSMITGLRVLEPGDGFYYLVTVASDSTIFKYKLDSEARLVLHTEIKLSPELQLMQHLSFDLVVGASEICLIVIATEDLYVISFNTGKVVHTFKNVVGGLASKLKLSDPYTAHVVSILLIPDTSAREILVEEGDALVAMSVIFRNPNDGSVKGCGCLLLGLNTRDWETEALSLFSHQDFSLTEETYGSRLNSNGRYLLAPDNQGRVFTWNMKSREIVGIISDNSKKAVRCSLFHSSSKWFLTGGDDPIVRVFEQVNKTS